MQPLAKLVAELGGGMLVIPSYYKDSFVISVIFFEAIPYGERDGVIGNTAVS
jgi:hypothetical protein